MADDTKLLAVFGAAVRSYRRAAGMPQRDLADRVGLTRASIANIETGRQDTTVTRIIAIAQALGVGPADLLVTDSDGADLSLLAVFVEENRRLRKVLAEARSALGGIDCG